MLRKQTAAELRGIAVKGVLDPDATKEAILALADKLDELFKLRCAVCQTEYITRRLDKKFCGAACRQSAYRERRG